MAFAKKVFAARQKHVWRAAKNLLAGVVYLLQQCLKLGLERGLGLCAHELIDQFAILEEEDGGDVADAILSSQVLILLDVTLSNGNLSVELTGQLGNHWAYHAAGSAPCSPKVNY